MIPLAGKDFPASAHELADAVRQGLADRGIAPARVQAQGAAWPALEALQLDMTGARLPRELRRPAAVAESSTGIEVAVLDIIGAPLLIEGVPVMIRLHGEKVSAAFSRGNAGELLLTFTRADAVTAEMEIARLELEDFLHRLAAGAAAQHGAEVRKVELALTSRGPRTLDFRADVTAKMFLMTAGATLAGELSVDDELNARVSNLRLDGAGMIGSMANNFLRPVLQKWEGRSFPLTAMSLGAMKVRDVELRGGESLRVRAKLGNYIHGA